jgi:GNAT superfamily N-acetyltransferase
VNVRQALPADAQEITRLYRQLHLELEGLGGRRVSRDDAVWEQIVTEMQALVSDPSQLFLVAEDSGKPEGFVHAAAYETSPIYEPARVLRVENVYLSPVIRGGKLADDLVNTALDWGRREGCVEADCQTLVQNRARHLLERGHFHVAGLHLRRINL